MSLIDDIPDVPPIPKPAPPRLAPSLIALALIVPALLVMSIVTFAIAVAVSGPSLAEPGAAKTWLAELIKTPGGVVFSVLPTQVTLLGGAGLLALLSPRPTAARLGLVRPTIGPATIALVTLGTVGVAVPMDFILPAIFGELSEHLVMMTTMFRQPGLVAAFVIYLHGAVLAGLSEELFFRGYVQTRLLERWPAVAAIAVPALTFSLLHLDPMHIAATVPSGLWLGWVTYRAGSSLPAIIAHIGNNAFAITAARVLDDPSGNIADGGPIVIAIAGLCVGALILSVVILRAAPRPVRATFAPPSDDE